MPVFDETMQDFGRTNIAKIYGGNYGTQKQADRLLRIELRNLRRQNRNTYKWQRIAWENRRPVDKAQRGTDYAGNDQLHRMPGKGCKNAFLRQPLPDS